MPESQKTFNFFINGEIKGPFTEVEANALVASGKITAETLCAPEGATAWDPAAKHLSFGNSAPSIHPSPATSTPNFTSINGTGGNDSPQNGPELPQHIRQKLIKLGLASATTIDMFNERQAIAAIKGHETGVRKAKNARILGAIGGFSGGALVALLVCLTPLGGIIGEIMGKAFASEKERYTKTRASISDDLARLDNEKGALDSAELRPPGNGSSGDKLRNRVRIPLNKRSLLLVKVDFSQLDPALRQKPRIVYFKKLDSSMRRKMEAQLAVALKYKNPEKLAEKLDETELAASWTLFRNEENNLIAEFAKTEKTASVEITDTSTGEWRIEGRSSQNIALAADITVGNSAPLTVYLPINNATTIVTTQEEMLETERYVVLGKRQLGNKFYGTIFRFQGRAYFLGKKSPALYYVQMRQEEFPNSAPIWVLTTEEFFNKTTEASLIPTKELMGHSFRFYDKPTEHDIGGRYNFKS
ncbi:MAG: DUF4339 domain-containing protein [Puniceicoccales bacterium]|jgi:hypothetical protein|nr:DUF4339 domain-containing protein [Puniceicoccales bacterium]